MPKISIIIPVYNVERYLKECVDSVLESTFTDYELLLVDDGSTDSSGAICDDYAEKDNRVKVFHKANGGVSSARNVGLDHARAAWITFVDSDDMVAPTFLENLYNPITEYPDIDFVQGGFTNLKNGKIADVEQQYQSYYGHDMNILCPIYRGRPYSHLIKRELLGEIRFDEHVRSAEDLLFTTDYLVRIKKFALSEEVGYYYRNDNENSIMHTPQQNSYSECLQFFNHQYSGVRDLVSTHGIERRSALIRYQQTADSLLIAVLNLFREKECSYYNVIRHLQNDISIDQLWCLSYVSGRKNRVVFTLLRWRKYKLFYYMIKKLYKL